MLNDIVLLWSIRVALTLYLVQLGLLIVGRFAATKRMCGLLGLGLLLIHVVAAYSYHDWNHARAVEQTAIDTKQTLGVAFGAGIYFNHLFVLLWLADIGCDWSLFRLRPNVRIAIHAYLVVIAINGAIVFESGPTRWVGISALTTLGMIVLRLKLRGVPER